MDPKIWDRINERVKATQFELKARGPLSWRLASRNLKHAADKLYDLYHDATLREISRFLEEDRKGQSSSGPRVLEGDELADFQDGQMISVYFLLMGYAIENLLKAILMIQHPEYYKPKGKMTAIRSHDLVDLCKRCRIPLQRGEAELLEKLKDYIEWQGKYPIPLGSDKMWPIRQLDGTWKTSGEAFHGRKTQQELDALYAKLLNELEQRHIPASG